MTKKWIKINGLSSGFYSVNKNRKLKTVTLRSDLCDYSYAYFAVKGVISFRSTNGANKKNKILTFKNNVPFRSCISKINTTFVDNVEDLDIAMPMYDLLEYSNIILQNI